MVLAQHGPDARPGSLPRHLRAADAPALADPVRAGTQRAAQFPVPRQLAAVPCAQREVLRLARLVVMQPGRAGKAVVGIGPQRRLLRIVARGTDPLGQLREPVAASLPHRGKRRGVPGQLQRDLIGLAGAVPAGDRGHGQHRTINTT